MPPNAPGVGWPASVTRALELIADRWTSLILREAFIHPCRFDGLQSTLSISRNTLTRRLNELVEHGLVKREQYHDRPPRHEYVLTDKGRELYGIFVVLKRWGDQWLAEEGDYELHLWHRPCGEHVHGQVVCEHCGEELDAADMDYAVGRPNRRSTRKQSKSGAMNPSVRASKSGAHQ